MPRSVTHEAIRGASKEAAATLHGQFQREGPHLYRQSSDLFHGIHFQASQWGYRDAGRFTINLIITARYLFEPWLGVPFPANPATAAFPIQVRIGLLMPIGNDYWWEVDRSTDLAATAAHASSAIVQYAVPLFDAWASARDLVDHLHSTNLPRGFTEEQAAMVRAMAAIHLDERDEAERIISAALADADGEVRNRWLSLATSLRRPSTDAALTPRTVTPNER